MFSSKNKKAQLVFNFEVMIKLILIAVFFVVLTFAGVRLYSAFHKSQDDKQIIHNFDVFVDSLNMQDDSVYSSIPVFVFLPNKHNYYIVLFNTNKLKVKNLNTINKEEVIYRPTKCKRFGPCVCLYKKAPVSNKYKKRNKNVMKCSSLNYDLVGADANIFSKYYNNNLFACGQDYYYTACILKSESKKIADIIQNNLAKKYVLNKFDSSILSVYDFIITSSDFFIAEKIKTKDRKILLLSKPYLINLRSNFLNIYKTTDQCKFKNQAVPVKNSNKNFKFCIVKNNTLNLSNKIIPFCNEGFNNQICNCHGLAVNNYFCIPDKGVIDFSFMDFDNTIRSIVVNNCNQYIGLMSVQTFDNYIDDFDKSILCNFDIRKINKNCTYVDNKCKEVND